MVKEAVWFPFSCIQGKGYGEEPSASNVMPFSRGLQNRAFPREQRVWTRGFANRG